MKNTHGLPSKQESRSVNWVILCGSALIAMAVSVSVGFVIGNERGKASNAEDIRKANNSSSEAKELQKITENKLSVAESKLSNSAKEIDELKKRIRELTLKLDGVAAEKKAIEDEGKKPKDDADLVIKRFGKPDLDKSSENEIPKPAFITRMLDYTKERVRFVYVLENDGKWKYVGNTDPVTNTVIEPEEAVKRLKDRDSRRQ